jgi:hypothetical protein
MDGNNMPAELSKKSIELIDKVIVLLSIPENQQFYNQKVYKEQSRVNDCETECCIAGWLVYANNKKEYESMLSDAIGLKARDLLRDSKNKRLESTNLFTSSPVCNWPLEFKFSFIGDPKDKVKKAIGMLKWFKKNAVTER